MKFLIFFILFHYVQTFSNKSNIIIILTDDQDYFLNGLNYMNKTRSLIADFGSTFTNAFVTTPICCPSRASILTGKYLHNHKTYNNSLEGGCSDHNWQINFEHLTIGSFFKKKDYQTFYAGKYLNQYGHKSSGGLKHIPTGWDWWIGLQGNSKYYNYTLSVNGSKFFFENDYLTDKIKNYGNEFLRYRNKEKNFLMVYSVPAPHAPFIPNEKYKEYFKNITIPRTPNFNIKFENRHWLISQQPNPLPQYFLPTLNEIYRRRWQTLLSVDDLVENCINKLIKYNLLNNTYIIFTSDHGYHIGQFGMPWDKRQPYETDIRVPLLIRGPGIPKKHSFTIPVLNIDLLPTIYELATKSELPGEVDGQSWAKEILELTPSFLKRTFLIEYHGEANYKTVDPLCNFTDSINLAECSRDALCKCQDAKNNSFTCLRKLTRQENFIFCKFDDNEITYEAYDLIKDPYQLRNIINNLGSNAISYYNYILKRLKSCFGINCILYNQ